MLNKHSGLIKLCVIMFYLTPVHKKVHLFLQLVFSGIDKNYTSNFNLPSMEISRQAICHA